MIDVSKGRYWDLPLSLVDGCTPCSPGCDHCWSAGIAHHYRRTPKHDGLKTVPLLTDDRGRFNGEVFTKAERLSIPMKRRKSTVYSLWNDLYHEEVPDDFRDQAYAVTAFSPWHSFLVLTKRPEGMRRYWKSIFLTKNVDDAKCKLMGAMPDQGRSVDAYIGEEDSGYFEGGHLMNVYHGLTVCNQQEADEKIPVFLQVPGKKFLSIEPMLGPIDLTPPERRGTNCNLDEWLEELDLIIAGAETGAGARPLHPEWVRAIRDRCENRTDMGRPWALPFFFKGWGEWIAPTDLNEDFSNCEPKGASFGPDRIKWLAPDGSARNIGEGLKRDGDQIVVRVGKKESGRLLDGREHNELPWVKP
jgi:protein gp37